MQNQNGLSGKISKWIGWKNSLINILFWIPLINGNFQGYKNSPLEFMGRNDTLRQVWGPKDASWEFRGPNDTSGQV